MLTRFVCLFLFLITLGVSMDVGAQSCPPGQYPVVGQGWNYCAQVPNNEPAESSAPVVTWKDQWQAIAVDKDKAALGTSRALPTRAAAETTALSDCSAKGGTNCSVQISYSNGCVAMIVGNRVMNTNGAATKEQAEQKGLRMCGAEDNNCTVYYSACSPPIRVN